MLLNNTTQMVNTTFVIPSQKMCSEYRNKRKVLPSSPHFQTFLKKTDYVLEMFYKTVNGSMR
jgi:hypothetical protein